MSILIVAVLGGAVLWLLPSAVLYWFFGRHQRLPHCQCGEQAVHPGSKGAYDPESGMLHELSKCYPEREHIGPIEYDNEEG